MPLTLIEHGDIFASQCRTLVCPVCCIPGVMGKGLALEFKRRWPSLSESHRYWCVKGGIYVCDERGAFSAVPLQDGYRLPSSDLPRTVILLPTKFHWSTPSRLNWVEAAAYWLSVEPAYWKSLAVPALGCGEGGLAWTDVEPVIRAALDPLPIPVELYAPHTGEKG